MKRFLALCIALVACAFVFAQKGLPPHQRDWAKFYRYEKLNAELLASGVRPDVVFMGNSITQNWAKYNPDFFKKNNFAGRGIGGQTTSHMLVRFRRDVIELNPRAVVIMAGINDIALNNGKITHENILNNIASMCELAKLHKIKVILCSVTPAVRFRWRPEVDFVPADEIIRLNKMIKEYAESHKIPYVDYHSALVDERKGMNRKYHKDEVHPNSLCYAEVLEPMILPVINKVLKTKHSYTTPIPQN
ncbi:MAG: acylhydrolase [Alistipes sp.]|nr:acylhydrolase [Alistipes sp.]